MPRVVVLFNKPRNELLAAAAAGRAPDELLYGLRALRRRGWDAVTTDAGFEDYLGGRALKALDNALSRAGARPGFHVKQAWRVRRQLREADVVFATADSSGLPVLALRALGAVATPVVYASIGLAETFGPARGAVYRFYRRLLRHAARIIVYAAPEAAELTAMFDLPPGLVRFVPFGVDTNFFATDAAPGERALAFGLDHRRDWPTLLTAAPAAGVCVDLIANPDVLRGAIIPAEVARIAPVSIDRLRDRLRAAKFVVLPVRENAYTGATISLLQSMAAGRAVIVSRTRAVAEGYGLVDGENCLLVPPGDVAALATAMRRLDGDGDLAARLGAAAAAHVRRGYDIEHLVTALDAALREAMP